MHIFFVEPMPIVPNEEHARVEVRGTPPGALEITNFNSVDMTVFSERNGKRLVIWLYMSFRTNPN